MEESMIRLQSLEIKNIKNVTYGRIDMPDQSNRDRDSRKADILGLYGQNGSGKTAVIDALYFLQMIMTGYSLKNELRDYITANENTAELAVEFAVFKGDMSYEVGYTVQIERNIHAGVEIKREVLSCAGRGNQNRRSRAVFMDYKREDDGAIFTPKKRLEELIGSNRSCRTDLIVAKKIAEKSGCSYIFGESSREIFFRENEYGFFEYSEIIRTLYRYALADLFVIRNSHSGMISANFLLPMAFRLDSNGRGGCGVKGDFAISMTEPTILNGEHRGILCRIVEQINTVLVTIIPGLKMDIRDYGAQLMENGREGCRVELVSAREGMPPIPIRMESEGIIKIISILNALIQAFGDGSICLAIDELDAGIFEYMLGELLDIFDRSAKGQLIFTSHNLRALEMLDKESIMFSTANPKQRYVHMKNTGKSRNLRDAYLRSITLGGQKEVIYEGTDSLKIARAFRKAGRGVSDGR